MIWHLLLCFLSDFLFGSVCISFFFFLLLLFFLVVGRAYILPIFFFFFLTQCYKHHSTFPFAFLRTGMGVLIPLSHHHNRFGDLSQWEA